MKALPGRLVLLGHPVAHSLSPAFQNAALRAAGIALTYSALDIPPDALDAALLALCSERAAGNVTIPHKERVAARCDLLTDVARRVGAVNTFWCDDGITLQGDNTDVAGFIVLANSISAGVDASGSTEQGRGVLSSGTVAVLGAGGAAAAVCAAVESSSGGAVRIWNRSPERAQRLAHRFVGVATAVSDVREAMAGAAIVVNTSPVGQHDDAFPVPIDALPKDSAVIDLVYRRGETAWVRAARARGHRAADGLVMLLEQGAIAFERWTGLIPDREAMAAALR